MRVAIGVTLVVIIVGAFVSAHAWPTPSGGAMPIAEAEKTADIGDYFTIEGVVVSGNTTRFFTIRDQSGEMLVLIPEYITRVSGTPLRNERVRLTGKFDQKKLDTSTKGMRVSKMNRMGKMTGASGSPDPTTSPDPTFAPSTPAAADPTPALSDTLGNGDAAVIEPTASRDMVDRLRDQRLALESARNEVDAAAEIYADALYAAGDDGKVDAAVAGRLQRAEAHMAEVQSRVPALVSEARAAGISDHLIDLYKRSAGMSY